MWQENAASTLRQQLKNSPELKNQRETQPVLWYRRNRHTHIKRKANQSVNPPLFWVWQTFLA